MSSVNLAMDPAAVIARRVHDITPVQARRGVLSRTSRFEDLFKYASTEARHQQWLNDPVTQAYLSALRDLSYLPYGKGILPVEGDAATQYGMTLAFQYAERLMTDPASVLPVFQAPNPGEEEPELVYSSYDDAPDSNF